ncbi:hypothetical protein L3Q82_009310 [Scortum barcoo]|uniref:Uncharacterized protein n=1 Tax=Scortum barcoo TaxID=214431 RepID=A0ACB8WG10_9TELE|nr:hypothetical protein L3Q82_009310 [Scortum barcoo]
MGKLPTKMVKLSMQEDSSRSPTYTVACEDYVHVVEFSPFSSGVPASLLAYGGNQYVVVGTCLFQEEDMEIEGVEFNVLRAFHHELRVDALAWSPESRLDRIPTIRFCTAAADRKLRLLTSDLQDRHEVKVMEGHTSYINHLVFEPTEGKQIASVSDDHTCRSKPFYFHPHSCSTVEALAESAHGQRKETQSFDRALSCCREDEAGKVECLLRSSSETGHILPYTAPLRTSISPTTRLTFRWSLELTCILLPSLYSAENEWQRAAHSETFVVMVWDLEGNESTTLRLRSPGISVCWHPEEAFKLMVAEKKGTIRFYDLVTQQAILSLDCGQSPLMSADWCLTNTIKVGAVAGNDWLIWDITRSSYPQEKRPAHIDKARLFKWSRASENLFATTGCPGKICSQLLIHHLGHPQPVTIGSATVGSGLSWHRTLPLCVVGSDRKLCFWMTEM